MKRPLHSKYKINLIHIGEITVIEVAAALAVWARQNTITKRMAAQAYQKFVGEFRGEYPMAPITSSLILVAASLMQCHPLKAYDATQLALATDNLFDYVL
jgi:predicted nucleic acid-binding protein